MIIILMRADLSEDEKGQPLSKVTLADIFCTDRASVEHADVVAIVQGHEANVLKNTAGESGLMAATALHRLVRSHILPEG